MGDSDALLTLLGDKIHGDLDCWGILLKKEHGKGHANAGAAHRILRRRIRRILHRWNS
jgi:hypothetical protein